MPNSSELEALISRVEKIRGISNPVDIAIEIALFEPDGEAIAIRANDAGTKVIYTLRSGKEETYWARDHTLNSSTRAQALTALRALSERQQEREG